MIATLILAASLGQCAGGSCAVPQARYYQARPFARRRAFRAHPPAPAYYAPPRPVAVRPPAPAPAPASPPVPLDFNPHTVVIPLPPVPSKATPRPCPCDALDCTCNRN